MLGMFSMTRFEIMNLFCIVQLRSRVNNQPAQFCAVEYLYNNKNPLKTRWNQGSTLVGLEVAH